MIPLIQNQKLLYAPLTLILSPEGRGNREKIPSPLGEKVRMRGKGECVNLVVGQGCPHP
jgi:hypothetical protein